MLDLFVDVILHYFSKHSIKQMMNNYDSIP